MTNRSHSLPATESPPRLSWPYRHPRLFPVTLLTGLVLIGTGLGFSIEIQVKVPLLVPITGAASTVLLVRAGMRRRLDARAAVQQMAGPSLGLRIDHALKGAGSDFIGRDERDAVLELLNQRYATAHLDDDEYGRRHTAVLWAKRRSELRPVLEGLTW